MTANHPSRRWHGCAMCKPNKDDSFGDPDRRTWAESVQMGTSRRWQRHDAPVEREPKGKKKNTKRWCKGKVGREHEWHIVYDKNYNPHNKWHQCRWVSVNWRPLPPKKKPGPMWWCFHQWACKNCGKLSDHHKHGWHGGVGFDDCPDAVGVKDRREVKAS